jgi:putative ABC transport system permease protein
MFALALQGLRGRKGPFVGAFIALMVAAALVAACAALLQAGLESSTPVERYAAAPIVVSGDQKAHINVGTDNEDSVPLYERVRIPAYLEPELRKVAGVRAAVADHGAPGVLIGPRGQIDGPGGHPTSLHPWGTATLAPYTIVHGRPPARAGEIVVGREIAAPAGVRVGQQFVLASNGRGRTVAVVGIARSSAPVERQGVVFATRSVVRGLAGEPRRVDAIGVIPADGVDTHALAERIRLTLHGRAHVATGSARGDVEHIETIEAREAITAIAGTFGGIALVIAMFVVASTIGLSVLQREREVALLRAVAATPKQIRRMIRWETIFIAVVASAVGVVPGMLLAGTLGDALAQRGIAPEDMEVSFGLIPVLAAIGSSVLTGLIAVSAAGRRAARVRPTVALQEAAGTRRLIGPLRVLAGFAMAGVAISFLAVASAEPDPTTAADLATGASFALVFAAAALGPLVVRVVAAVAALVLGRRRGSVSAFLAVSNMRTGAARFASAMTPLILTVGISSTLLFSGTTREHATAQQERERVAADLVVQSGGPGIPRQALADIRRVAGVGAAAGVAETTLGPSLGSTYSAAQVAVVDPGAAGMLDLDVRDGSLDAVRGRAIALSKSQAATAGASVGDRVDVTLGDGGHARVRVAAIYRRGLGFADVVMPPSLAAGHVTSPLLSYVLVDVRPSANEKLVAQRLRRLGTAYPGLTVGDRNAHAVRADHDRETDNWLFRILAAIIFVFTAIAVVNTLMMIALHRTRELALLRLIGATRKQVLAMARWEGTVTVALGLTIGAAIALITLVPTAAALSGSLPAAPIALVVLVFGSAAAISLIATQVATRLALRPRPADRIGARD